MVSSEINVNSTLNPYFCWRDRTFFTDSKKTTDGLLGNKTYFLIWAAFTLLLRNYTAITRLLQLNRWHLCGLQTSGHPLKVSSHPSAIAEWLPQLQYVHEYKSFRLAFFECIEQSAGELSSANANRLTVSVDRWRRYQPNIRDLFVKTYRLCCRRIAAPIWKLNMPLTIKSPYSTSHSDNYSPRLQIVCTFCYYIVLPDTFLKDISFKHNQPIDNTNHILKRRMSRIIMNRLFEHVNKGGAFIGKRDHFQADL